MKKLLTTYFSLLLLVFFCFLGKAQNYPTITPLTNGFTFINQQLETHINGYRANTLSCSINFTNSYRYYSFKANFDMAFAFDLIAPNSGFKFLVWKLPAGSTPESIFLGSNSTLNPSRSVEGLMLVKGLKETETEICEDYNTPGYNGYAKGFSGDEQLLKDEVVVIAIYGQNNTDQFDLKINVAEEREINSFNYKCINEPYTYNEIINAIQSDSNLTDITLYSDSNFTTALPAGSTFSQHQQTIYAQVKDATGKLIYIYKIPLWLRIPSDFSEFFLAPNDNLRRIQTCETTFLWKGKAWYLNEYLQLINPADFDIIQIKYYDVNGNQVVINDPENQHTIQLTSGNSTSLMIVTKSINPLKCDNQSEIALSITNETLTLNENYTLNKCEGTPLTYEEIKNLIFQNGYNGYELVTDFVDGSLLNFGSNSQIRIPLKVRYGSNNCLTNQTEIIINKTSPVNIKDVDLVMCENELTSAIVDLKLEEIKNGTNANLQFYYNNNEVESIQLYGIMRQVLQGYFVVKSTDGCVVEKRFSFNLLKSSITFQNEIMVNEENCVNHTDVINYTNQQLNNIAYRNILNPQSISNYTFRYTDDLGNIITSVTDLQNERRIRVEVKLNSETCWTAFDMDLKRTNRPVINQASRTVTASCDDTIRLTRELLIELFGPSIMQFQMNRELNQVYPIDFNGGVEATFLINFYQNENCQVIREIKIIKGENLSINIDQIQLEATTNPYRFCGNANLTDVATYIQYYIDQVQSIYPTVQPEQSVDAYAQQMINRNGNVEVVFLDPNQCGSKILSLSYNPYPSPNLAIDTTCYTCTGYLYRLDMPAYENVRIYRSDRTRVLDINGVFELDLGDYTVEVENEFGCITSKSITVQPSPLPVIEEIILNVDAIEVIAKGNGGLLEYSLDGVNWQNSNKFLGIQKGVNYTIYVRENQCALVSIPNVVYLNLPNFISPNGDGINDIWKPIGVNSTLDVRIQIFNRYGKVVYQAEGPNALNWDGRFNHKPLPSDSYWYFIEYIDKQAVIKLKYQGYITIKSSK